MAEQLEPERKTSAIQAQVTDSQKDLANTAQLEFENNNFSACVFALNKLHNQRSSDLHVKHNLAIAEFYASDSKKLDNLWKTFKQICDTCKTQPENTKNLEDVDQATTFYNVALIYYHQRQYTKALSVTDGLFQIIDSLDEELAKKTMFLLIELYICTHQAEKSMGLLAYVERSLQGTMTDSSDKSENKDSSLSAMWKSRISQYKLRCFLLMKSFKVCKREMKSLTTSNPSSNLLFGYLKSNFEYLRGNFRKAIKILASTIQSPSLVDRSPAIPVMYFNNLSCIHFSLGKPNLATFYLRKAFKENEKVVADTGRENNRSLYNMSVNHHFELLYNLGLQLLHSNQPLPAFECLRQCLEYYRNNPRLWLRLAESCIMAKRLNNEVDSSLDKQQLIIDGSVGMGIHRKLILGTGMPNSSNGSDNGAMPAPSLEFAALCLQNALALLPDANKQTGETTEEVAPKPDVLLRATPGNPMRPPEVLNLQSSILCASAYVSLCLHDYVTALNYSNLLLSQPQLSHAHRYLGRMYLAEALVTADRLSDAADQLDPQSVTDVSLTPPQVKVDQDLKMEKGDKENNENNGELSSNGVLQSWYPRDVQKARAIMRYNLAVCYAHRGAFQIAQLNLAKSIAGIGDPLPAQMIYLKIYLSLTEGQRKAAQTTIKENFGHTTPNYGDANVGCIETIPPAITS